MTIVKHRPEKIFLREGERLLICRFPSAMGKSLCTLYLQDTCTLLVVVCSSRNMKSLLSNFEFVNDELTCSGTLLAVLFHVEFVPN